MTIPSTTLLAVGLTLAPLLFLLAPNEVSAYHASRYGEWWRNRCVDSIYGDLPGGNWGSRCPQFADHSNNCQSTLRVPFIYNYPAWWVQRYCCATCRRRMMGKKLQSKKQKKQFA